MTVIDFEKLNSSSFHSMRNDLVKAEYHDSICPEGVGGDDGIDCYVENFERDGSLHIFQHKYLPHTLGSSGKRQISKSLKQAKDKHKNLTKWTLLIPKNLTIQELKWFKSLRGEYPTVDLEIWDSTKLRQLLTKHYRLCYDHFRLPDHLMKPISNHKTDLNDKVITPLIAMIKKDTEQEIRIIMNEFLYKDLTTNHEIYLDTELKSLLDCIEKINNKDQEMHHNLSEELIRRLELNF